MLHKGAAQLAPTPNLCLTMMKLLLTNSLLAATLVALGASPALAQKNDWTLNFPETKARFVKVQMEWAKKEPYWNPTREELEAKFDQLDTDKDGLLSEEEWQNKDGAKKPKKKEKKKEKKS